MRVLTNWATGNPPCAGWWLSRIHENEFSSPSLYYWDGKQWSYKNGFVASVQDREWCGLAFNPKSAQYVMRWQDLTLEIEEFTL